MNIKKSQKHRQPCEQQKISIISMFLLLCAGDVENRKEALFMFTTLAQISEESWQCWRRYRATTCQSENDDAENAAVLTEHMLNSTDHVYFHWEQREFHRRLRQRLLPGTAGDDSLRSLIGSSLLSSLDPRLFIGTEAKTVCIERRTAFSEAAEQRRMLKEDLALFEDSIISRVFND